MQHYETSSPIPFSFMTCRDDECFLRSHLTGGIKPFRGELPLRGDAQYSTGRREALSGEAPTARDCSIEGGRMLFLGGLPLRGAD